jgi:hypothetical protein
MKKFVKRLSANDVGTTGGHMGGILVPKGDGELLAFLPPLDTATLNPSAWIDCETPDGSSLRLRFVYYNNRLHVEGGTRNEFRITYLTKFLRDAEAREGDFFEIAREEGAAVYRISVLRKGAEARPPEEDGGPLRVRLTTSWRRVH